MTAQVGKYKVLDRLGRGGMGEVFRAIQVDLEREVALKVLSEDASARRAKERFLREAKLQAQLEHPNLVRVYDAGTAGKRFYFAMELVTGETLSKRIRRAGRAHPAFVAGVAQQMASAFQYFHPLGMVHRDLKPSNLMVMEEDPGTVKLMDFGIAMQAGAERLTRTRGVVGTARYLSPEMARGADEITGASDVYQLGLILYEMVVGSPPHSGPPAVAMARRAAGERAPDPRESWSSCPERLAALINGCLEPNPADRLTTPEIEEEATALEMKLRNWQPPAEPAAPWVPPDSASPDNDQGRPDGRTSQPNSALTGPLSNTVSQVVEEARSARLWVGVVLVLAAVFFGRHLSAPREYGARQVLIRPGARGVVLTWSSDLSYPTRIRYGPEGSPEASWSDATTGTEGTAHRLVLEGLTPGTKYECKVLLPDGSSSLVHDFTAPRPFEVRGLRFQIAGEDTVEWRWSTPSAVKSRLTVETAELEELVREESEPTLEHVARFPLAKLIRAPRVVEPRWEAADGVVDSPWPRDRALSLMDHVAWVYSPEEVNWFDLVNSIDEIRTGLGGGGRGWQLGEWQAELQTLVKERLGAGGLYENWAVVGPRVRDFVESDAPWEERRRVLRSLAYLSMVDRIYDLYSVPPYFQVLGRVANVMAAYRTPPLSSEGYFDRQLTFPYRQNVMVAANYSEKARNQINGLTTGIFPNKGDVLTVLEADLEIPGGLVFEETFLGVDVRAVFPFSVLQVHLRPPGSTDPSDGLMIPFYEEPQLSDAPLKDEFSLLKYMSGKPLDEIFPGHQLWMRVPPECFRPGRNLVRVELISLQHHSIVPSAVRRVMFRARVKKN